MSNILRTFLFKGAISKSKLAEATIWFVLRGQVPKESHVTQYPKHLINEGPLPPNILATPWFETFKSLPLKNKQKTLYSNKIRNDRPRRISVSKIAAASATGIVLLFLLSLEANLLGNQQSLRNKNAGY